ncbi:hypothetical protein GCM10009628_22120 [Paeniglutamicibacter kerguelensis]|uniref:MFS transporter n=1 Tax=Paeniglutamicibacter kerguelensis TaxID=254788 RepID=A0ABS4XHX5_9MICC|nr:hypothetical protein [Paeniglutamicibacter kerguelensis]
MTSRGSRVARGWIGALFATGTAAVSHVLGGGAAPHPLLVILSLAVSGSICCTLAGRLLSLTRMALGVLASQAFFHMVFGIGNAPARTSASPLITDMHHAHAGMAATPPITFTIPVAELSGHGVQMWFGHAVAAILTVLFLRYGEVSAVRLVEAFRLKITLVLRLVHVWAPAPRRLKASATTKLFPLSNLGLPLPVMRHRGPPAHASVS